MTRRRFTTTPAILIALTALAASFQAAAQTPVERGAYLVNVMTCHNCHTPMGPTGPVFDRAFSGGPQVFNEAAFTVRGANITPDAETGIGRWSDADIKKLLRTGVRPNGTPIAPIMPTGFYEVLTESDLDALVAYMRQVKPIRNEVAAPVYKAALQRQIPTGAEKPFAPADLADTAKRGFYLATIAHCMECHSPIVDGKPALYRSLGTGGQEFKGPWGVSVSRNITSHREKGLGGWSDAEIKRAITEGISRDGSKLKPPMGYPYYAKMTAADLDALVAYLRTVAPRE